MSHVSNKDEAHMQVRCKLFKSSFSSWESLCDDAAAFAVATLAVKRSKAVGSIALKR